MKLLIVFLLVLLVSCVSTTKLKREISHQNQTRRFNSPTNLDSLIVQLNALSSRDREKILVPIMLNGSIPAFNLRMKKIKVHFKDNSGKKFKAILFVSPDYLCIGNNDQFMRMPLTPQSAQQICDSLHCVLPTAKIVDEIYRHASIKIEPHPLTDARDSFATFLVHNKIIQQHLKDKHAKKLTAGIKKDVVQTPQIYTASKPNRVAIYGWHQLNGKAIQPLYTGHVDWYVDYSHGIRLVYEKMTINNKIYFVKDILNDPRFQQVICNEPLCNYTRYKSN